MCLDDCFLGTIHPLYSCSKLQDIGHIVLTDVASISDTGQIITHYTVIRRETG